ncbi:ion-transporting P-type ATPase SPF1 [Sugiyamaella lignohabitans]|uniref:Ion-transporting P-type ATPase SPF1 n=1 Tax=Sugiyamaella lignohabitans TaxID=796027 RepID=A0A167EGB3_9ASCO|nr:ion-transporting P-type ATPase SPF1 [Sugiyamaella lignohabitans]ANB14046.1 ion-transporting P-type ATPase SPF1 [Sugiyamaella lignohabitans]
MSVQALLALMPFWNVEIKKKFTTKPAETIEKASLIRLIPVPNSGAPEICKIQKIDTADHQEVSFLFQKRRYIYDDKTKSFSPPKFAIDESDIKLGSFQTTKGISGGKAKIDDLIRKYGPNKFDIPVPTFSELWLEHAVAPFFVFQMFCVALWFMDELWYYSLFSLFMLVAFESTVVFQRQKTMAEFRGMGIQPYDIHVYRDNKWVEIQTDGLLPGDLVSVTRTKEDSGLPCDLILINGSAIVNEAMLSGESTPLLKESIQLRPSEEKLDTDSLDKNSLLFGGTKVLQTTEVLNSHVPLPPDGGALAVVTRTGFETSQGSLVRVMIFSTERVGAGNKEAYFFILFLLVFAIAASWYVWTEGVKVDRKRSKLLLDCVLIITSVVPPELPMELTMAVNASLAALGKFYIYCTEPFRIPFAGRVDVCCFDKTGTLTNEDLVVEGIAGLVPGDIRGLTEISNIPQQSALVLASAHALVLLDDGEVVGDPMEKTTLNGIGWIVEKKDRVRSKTNPSDKLHILRRFQFSSALKRSSSIANVDGKTLVAVKGAPETLRKMITKLPEDYEETYKSFTRTGSRVLAFAYKYLEPNMSESKVTALVRENVESDLIFAGFLVFHCPLKEDAVKTVKMLNESSHRVVMITGDNPLTAVHVANEVAIVEREVLILDAPEEAHGLHNELVWRSVDEKTIIPVKPSEPLDIGIFENYDLCVTGYALAKLTDHEHIVDLIRHTWVYARVSPSQKEFILTTLKEAGYTTLMCGDGTNDVGALKQAHVGVALLNGTEEGMKKIAENNKINALQKIYEKQADLMRKWNQPPPPIPQAIAHLYPPGPKNPHYVKAIQARGGVVDEKLLAEIEQAQKRELAANKSAALADKITAMMEEDDENDPPALKLGDASVAAPFTSKLGNVSAITHIIRQGRCTLVATIQMYKILALNCLISAYSLSVLYLAGIKIGDGQATISGILLSVCFLSISRAKAIDELSKQRPQPGIFNFYIMGSILGQFAIHIATLIYITNTVYKLEPRDSNIDLEAEFKPSLLNTAIYLLQLAQQISTFAVNYQGRPFRDSISENRGMYWGLLGVGALALSGATEFIPEMNEGLKLVPMSSVFKFQLSTTMLLDLGGSWLIEIVLKHFFMDSKPADIALRYHERPGTLIQKKNQ